MAQDAFSTFISDSKAPGGPDSVKRAEYGSAKVVRDDVGTALEAAGSLLAGGAEIATSVSGKAVEKAIDAAVDVSFEAAFPIDKGSDIDRSLNKLQTIKDAVGQGKDTSDRFQLTLMKEMKTVRANNPGSIAAIDKALRDRGLVDPRVYLMNEQAKREQTADQVRLQREDAVLTASVNSGLALYKEPGNPNSPIDRTATLSQAHEIAAISAKQNAAWAVLGYRSNEKGEVVGLPSGIRLAYAQEAPKLKQGMYEQVVVGLGPLANSLKYAIASGGDKETIKASAQQLVFKAKEFELAAEAKAVGLNANESKDYTEFVKGLTLQYVQMALPVANSGDLNAAKTLASTLDIFANHAKAVNWAVAPDLMRFIEGAPKEVVASLIPQLLQTSEAQTEMRKLGAAVMPQLKSMLDMTSSKTPPGGVVSEFSKDEQEYSKEDRKARVAFHAVQMQESINKNIVVADKDKAEWWVRSHIPVIKSFYGVSDQVLQTKDLSTLTAQITSNNYMSNLSAVQKHYPEEAAKIGGYAFDVVQKNVLNQIRELQSVSGKSIVWSNNEKKFVEEDLSYEASIPGMPLTSGTDTLVNRRLVEVNKSLPSLISNRQFKEQYKGMSETEFVSQIGSDIGVNPPSPVVSSPSQSSEKVSSGVFEELPNMIDINNPGNIKHGSTKWEGMSSEQPHKTFVSFDTPEAGIRAMTRLINTYYTKYSLGTVRGIIERWAPPNENQTSNYVRYVSTRLGVEPTDNLDLNKPGVLKSLIASIIQMENGSVPYTDEQMNKGIKAGWRGAVEVDLGSDDNLRGDAKDDVLNDKSIPDYNPKKDKPLTTSQKDSMREVLEQSDKAKTPLPRNRDVLKLLKQYLQTSE